MVFEIGPIKVRFKLNFKISENNDHISYDFT